MNALDDFNVLLVEDNADSREAAEDEILRQIPEARISWAGDAESAMAFIDAGFFDLAVCDLKIPARPRELTTNESNGISIVSRLQRDYPGTPIIIFSAYGTVENTEPYTAGAERLAAHGVPDLKMCQAATKGSSDSFAERLSPISSGLKELAGVQIAGASDLEPFLRRAISQFAVDRSFSSAEVTKVGGLSGSSNAIVTLRGDGVPPLRTFVKENERVWLLDEIKRQDRFVHGYLDSSNWASRITTLKAGLRDRAAYFSSLAANSVSFFELAASDEVAARAVLDKLEAAIKPWEMRTVTNPSIGDLRRAHLSDDELAATKVDLGEFRALEALRVNITSDVIHGDLHGENVLVMDAVRPVLVDFAYCEIAPGVTDPVTLEMSFLFHPETPLTEVELRDIDLENWAEGHYAEDTQFEAVLRRCREWSLSNRSPDEFYAMSYAHAIRHLKRGTSPQQVMSVARSAARALGH
jgi:CheY-like chemotaxis protein